MRWTAASAAHSGLALRLWRRLHDGGKFWRLALGSCRPRMDFVLGTVVAILGIGCLALMRGPQDLVLLLLYTASGFGFGMRIAQLSTIPADVFAGPHLGAILGVVQAGGGLGGAIGPFLGGWLFDITGKLPAGVHGRLCRGRGLGRRGVARGTAHGQRVGRAALTSRAPAREEQAGRCAV